MWKRGLILSRVNLRARDLYAESVAKISLNSIKWTGNRGRRNKTKKCISEWKKLPEKEGERKKTGEKRKETWHFGRTLSCSLADIIIVKLGGRFRLSCRCGSLKLHSMSPCHFSSTSLPSNPSFTHSAPGARCVWETQHARVWGQSRRSTWWHDGMSFFRMLAWGGNVFFFCGCEREKSVCLCI